MRLYASEDDNVLVQGSEEIYALGYIPYAYYARTATE